MCTIHSKALSNCIALATENRIKIGSTDDIQKLHIRTIPLGEMPRRIAFQVQAFCLCNNFFQDETKTLCVLTVQIVDEREVNNVRLFNADTFESLNVLSNLLIFHSAQPVSTRSSRKWMFCYIITLGR